MSANHSNATWTTSAPTSADGVHSDDSAKATGQNSDALKMGSPFIVCILIPFVVGIVILRKKKLECTNANRPLQTSVASIVTVEYNDSFTTLLPPTTLQRLKSNVFLRIEETYHQSDNFNVANAGLELSPTLEDPSSIEDSNPIAKVPPPSEEGAESLCFVCTEAQADCVLLECGHRQVHVPERGIYFKR
mmetsp:Transcript_57698/g.151846  ORF Transcript_57698/g.151846 Transcript_57698/m.151846 type:complete len:190 (-) Transcript_57698:46-615(-)